MTKEVQPIINIEASLMNVQRGDVMIIRFPDGELTQTQKERQAKVIRDMLIANGIDIPVIMLPYKWEVTMVEKGEEDLLKEIDEDEDN